MKHNGLTRGGELLIAMAGNHSDWQIGYTLDSTLSSLHRIMLHDYQSESFQELLQFCSNLLRMPQTLMIGSGTENTCMFYIDCNPKLNRTPGF
jgi:hypothetical protein